MTSTQLKFELFEDGIAASSPDVAAAVEALAKQEGAENRGAIFTRPEVIVSVGKNGGDEPSLNTNADSSHSFGMTNNTVITTADSSHLFGMTNNTVISTEGRNLMPSGHRIEDHFADVSKMIEIGKGGRREVDITLLSRYACYLVIQNADPNKEIVAQGQTYFAIQTRRQELADEHVEENRRLLLREEMRRHFTFLLSFRTKGEISCPTRIGTTYTS